MADRVAAARMRVKRSPSCRALFVLLFSMVVGGCGEPVATPEPVVLQVAGAPELAVMVEALAEAFQAATPNVTIEVNDPGSSAALEVLRGGDIDLAFVSWPPAALQPAADAEWHSVAVARDGLAVIVHADNPVTGVGLLQLQDLFSGRAAEWGAVGGGARQGVVHPVVREEGSGARTGFDALVMEGNRITPRAVVATSPSAAVSRVAADVRAIGYVSTAFVGPGVKVLEVEGLVPGDETIEAGSYPLAYELWLVAQGAPEGMVREFLDWAVGPAGQEIVGRFFQKVR